MRLAMREFGPRPTLGELQRTTPWVWLWCFERQTACRRTLGLAVLGWGGVTAFFSHPALIALAVTTLLLSGMALFSGGNLSPGIREDRSNRWVWCLHDGDRARQRRVMLATLTMTVTPRMATLTLLGTLAYLWLNQLSSAISVGNG